MTLLKRFWRALGRRYLDWWTLAIVVAAGYFASLTYEFPRSAAVWVVAAAASGVLMATVCVAVFRRWRQVGVAGAAADGVMGHRRFLVWNIVLSYAVNAVVLIAAGAALVGVWSMAGIGGPFIARFALAGLSVLAARHAVDLGRQIVDFHRGCVMLLTQRDQS